MVMAKRFFWHAHQVNLNVLETNRATASHSELKQVQGNTKTPMLYTVDNVAGSLGNVILPINKTLQGFMYYSIGQSRIMPVSSPNGSLSGARGYNQPHDPNSGYSERLGRWMPDSYFDGF